MDNSESLPNPHFENISSTDKTEQESALETFYKTRIEFFKKVIECPVLSEKNINDITTDSPVVATLLGYKPLLYLPSDDDYIRPSLLKLQDYYKKNPDTEEAKYFLNELVITNDSLYNKASFTNLLEERKDFLAKTPFSKESLAENSQQFNVLLDQKLDAQTDPRTIGALIDFPLNSVENYELYEEARTKREKYLDNGKQKMISDGWTNADVDILIHKNKSRDTQQEKQVWKKYQEKIGLSDDEISTFLADKKFEELGMFGYQGIYFPEPKTKYSEAEEKQIVQKTAERKYIEEIIKYHQQQSIEHGLPDGSKAGVSYLEMVWYHAEYLENQ